MAGYGPTEMVQTPWGRADQLRERMLRPGPGMAREDVARSQRERLFGATVACVASQGYEATTVADLLELSGVSRSAFYEHFRDKEDCVLATFEELIEGSMSLVRAEMDQDGSWDARATHALDALFDAIVKQEAAASLCFCDIYAVGERGRLAVERAMAQVTEVVEEAIAGIRGSRLPRNLVHGLVGGTHIVIQTHLRREEAERLPEYAKALRELALSYEAPSVPLRLGGRRPRPTGGPPPFVAYSQAEKIVRALAAAAGERGYPAVTVAEIAARASISQATFYSHFADKHAALVAAIDSAGTQMLGVAMPAARRASDWPNAIRAALGGLCAFYASEPDLARLAVVEIYAAGPAALTQRDRRFEAFLALLEPALEASPDTHPVVADLVLGAVWTLVYEQITTGEPEELPRLAPVATYVILSPFLGSRAAVRVSNGDGRNQQTR
jgi:AcrR family transcriptional regulator